MGEVEGAAQTQGEVPHMEPGIWEGFTEEAASRLGLEECEALAECRVEGPTGENECLRLLSFQRSSECCKKVESRSWRAFRLTLRNVGLIPEAMGSLVKGFKQKRPLATLWGDAAVRGVAWRRPESGMRRPWWPKENDQKQSAPLWQDRGKNKGIKFRMRPFHSQAEGLHPLSPLLGSSPSVCPNIAECGRGDDSTPFFPDKKTEAQSPRVGTEVKREWKRPAKGGCPKSRTILRRSRGLPHYSVSRPQPAAFAIETVIVIFLYFIILNKSNVFSHEVCLICYINPAQEWFDIRLGTIISSNFLLKWEFRVLTYLVSPMLFTEFVFLSVMFFKIYLSRNTL